MASTALVFLTILGNSLTIARSDTLDGDRVNNHKIIEITPAQPVPSLELHVQHAMN
ncbi:hypothetical protein [aff. Roholtiella sp. LEGE 12411]|uniref:hypothetical protein n=1 Tax=aff. Roholtiella sp. LEGE 12411 TaxID=1828822 RepID=UPI0018830F07|nr:hypothetical protein [aff. Roholtiella sp. LEGE 12411]MBE9036073.1 hypothetical protein [aff. Roholtiella sp. LEGE 12411]